MMGEGGVTFATAAGDEATRAIARLRLDDVLAAARSHDVEGALARLFQGLAEVKARAAPETWARVWRPRAPIRCAGSCTSTPSPCAAMPGPGAMPRTRRRSTTRCDRASSPPRSPTRSRHCTSA